MLNDLKYSLLSLFNSEQSEDRGIIVNEQGKELRGWDDLSSYGGYELGINPDTAMKLSVVYSCVKIISETIASLPLRLYKETSSQRNVDVGHPVQAKLLSTEPSELQTWFTFHRNMIATCARWGNSYALITRNKKFEPIELRFLPYGDCYHYYYRLYEKETIRYFALGREVEPYNIIHLTSLGNDGVTGLSPLQLASDSIDLGLQSLKTTKTFYGRNLKSQAVFSTDMNLKDTTFEILRQRIKQQLGNDYFLLEGGIKATTLNLSLKDAEIIETRRFTNEDIARIYRVPLHKIGELSRSTNNNIEQQATEFVTDCIVPWCRMYEGELEKKLLFAEEKPTRSFAFDVDYIMRGDSKARSEYYKNMFMSSAIAPNEIRKKEGINEHSNKLANELFAQMQMQPLGTQINNDGNAQQV